MVLPINPIQGATGFALGRVFEFSPNTLSIPVTLQLPSTGEKFTLPVDPLVSISHKNKIVAKSVAKYSPKLRGTIKEKWSMDDWTIRIAGMMISDEANCVEDYVLRLRKFVEADEAIMIICPYINDTYDITRMVIESCDFPHTPGEENQQFSISAISDDERINLLV